MYSIMVIQSQLLATKFYIPISSRKLILRSGLNALLNESLKYPLTLVSAPAGFGKTMSLSAWTHSLPPASSPLVSWVSLDEEDNDPLLFWTYILSALDQQQPERFTPLLKALQSPAAPPLMSVLTALLNSVQDSAQHLVLILDDYHVITEQQIHTTLSYFIEHLPAHFHLILATRVDPPLPLSRLRSRRQLLEVRTDQLRCTAEETKALLSEAMGIEFSNDIIQEVAARTEGWLVGLQLLALSLQERPDPTILLGETSGNQRYILDFLTQEVLRQQPQEVQTFLLSTCILERLTASLCDAVMEHSGSQQMLERLERANLFLTSLDNQRRWYRYHALFAQALSSQLECNHANLMPILHARASRWYAQHHQTTAAILHAFQAKEWHWAADLIERMSIALNALTWGVSQHQLFVLRDWLLQIPVEIISSRPRFCLASIWMLLPTSPQAVLEVWLNVAETKLNDQLLTLTQTESSSSSMLVLQEQRELENMLGEAITYRAFLQSFHEDGETVLTLCQQAEALLSSDNFGARAHMAVARIFASYSSSLNDAVAAIQVGLEASSSNQAAGKFHQAISLAGVTAMVMIGTGQLHKTLQIAQQAILLGSGPATSLLPTVASSMCWQAELLREWNQLDTALSCIEEAMKLCEQHESTLSPVYFYSSYLVLLRVCLSCGDYKRACFAFQQLGHINQRMNQSWSNFRYSLFTIVDQVRLWIACGELDRAIHWAEQLDLIEQHLTPFAHERQEVARARILLAQDQPTAALQRLEPARQRAAVGQRWGHVLEIRLLQALAYQKLNEESQALVALSEAVRLGEPEGYIRSFVDEGSPMADLLRKLRDEQCQTGPTPYLDTLLAAFAQESKRHGRLLKRKKIKGDL